MPGGPPPRPMMPPMGSGGWAPPPSGYGYAAPPSSSGGSKGGGRVLAMVLFVIIALAIGAGVLVAANRGDEDATDSRSTPKERTTTTVRETTTTTEPRVNQEELLSAYCDAPGSKWPEVPPHVAEQPDRTYVRYQADVPTNGADVNPDGTFDVGTRPTVGSTVIAPHTDGRFTHDPSVMQRTRTVACITFDRTESTGRQCFYVPLGQGNTNSGTTVDLSRNRFMIIVYELHSGGVLHKGELWTRSGHCPERADTSTIRGAVTYALTDQEILDWMGSHFIDGRPH